ncbi:hypothetical protein D3C86_1855300 [compost metagenome]
MNRKTKYPLPFPYRYFPDSVTHFNLSEAVIPGRKPLILFMFSGVISTVKVRSSNCPRSFVGTQFANESVGDNALTFPFIASGSQPGMVNFTSFPN